MKQKAKLKKDLIQIKQWLKKARMDLMPRYLQGNHGEFMLLIAVEGISRYLENLSNLILDQGKE